MIIPEEKISNWAEAYWPLLSDRYPTATDVAQMIRALFKDMKFEKPYGKAASGMLMVYYMTWDSFIEYGCCVTNHLAHTAHHYNTSCTIHICATKIPVDICFDISYKEDGESYFTIHSVKNGIRDITAEVMSFDRVYEQIMEHLHSA